MKNLLGTSLCLAILLCITSAHAVGGVYAYKVKYQKGSSWFSNSSGMCTEFECKKFPQGLCQVDMFQTGNIADVDGIMTYYRSGSTKYNLNHLYWDHDASSPYWSYNEDQAISWVYRGGNYYRMKEQGDINNWDYSSFDPWSRIEYATSIGRGLYLLFAYEVWIE